MRIPGRKGTSTTSPRFMASARRADNFPGAVPGVVLGHDLVDKGRAFVRIVVVQGQQRLEPLVDLPTHQDVGRLRSRVNGHRLRLREFPGLLLRQFDHGSLLSAYTTHSIPGLRSLSKMGSRMDSRCWQTTCPAGSGWLCPGKDGSQEKGKFVKPVVGKALTGTGR